MICSLLWISTTAQTFTISGNVLDDSSGEPLIGASVIVPGTTFGVVTNNYGYYSLELAQGEYAIQVSYLGFELLNQPVTLNENQRIDFYHLQFNSVGILITKPPTNWCWGILE